ncbi:MAG: NAD(P)/FAD-dependent oxidoreductase [Polyangiaceae bacterium]|nr:NAD(P)/FAD-dependent oxidoreductase [Polyangiaceae bacterium]
MYDVLVLGGGPAGLAAALTLGRARKRVLLCDGGVRRNAAATHLHNFVTRDGTPPLEFRRIAREQLAPYDVTVRDVAVETLEGAPDAFQARMGDGTEAKARRILLATGMIDEMPPIPGFRELWGHAIFQCPYCHGWEVRDQAFGFLPRAPEMLEHGLFLQNWSPDLVAFTQGAFEVPAATRARLESAGVRIEERRIERLVPNADGSALEAVELEGAARIARQVLFAVPVQRQTAIVSSLGLEYDAMGFLKLDDQRRTSRPGIWGAGDATVPMQSATTGAAGGMMAAHFLNHELALVGK